MRAPTLATAGAIGVLAALASCAARAQEGFDGWSGPFQLLLRGVYLAPQNPAELHLDGGFYGELSAAWFMTPVLSMELSLAEVSRFNTRINQPSASINRGAMRLMPNTWTLQYDLAPQSAVRPYLGVGLHYTSVATEPVVGNETFTAEGSRLGWVLQAGIDLRIAGGWFANADVRYLGGLAPRIVLNNSLRITGSINPLLIGGGVGFRW